jgi:F-type H+-transporting ATPase subunit alpha
MKQKQYAPMSIAELALSVYAVEKGYLDVCRCQDPAVRSGLHAHFHSNYGA